MAQSGQPVGAVVFCLRSLMCLPSMLKPSVPLSLCTPCPTKGFVLVNVALFILYSPPPPPPCLHGHLPGGLLRPVLAVRWEPDIGRWRRAFCCLLMPSAWVHKAGGHS